MIVVRVVRDMGEPLQPASRQVGRLRTVSMLGKKCQIRAQHQRTKCNKSVRMEEPLRVVIDDVANGVQHVRDYAFSPPNKRGGVGGGVESSPTSPPSPLSACG